MSCYKLNEKINLSNKIKNEIMKNLKNKDTPIKDFNDIEIVIKYSIDYIILGEY